MIGPKRVKSDLKDRLQAARSSALAGATSDGRELPQSRYLADGSAELGGGTIPAGSFTVEVEDESRACGCECKKSPTGRTDGR